MSIVIRGNSAAVLSRHPLVDAGRVGVLGESEGGWVAPLAAQRAPSNWTTSTPT